MPASNFFRRLVSESGRKGRLRQLEPDGDIPQSQSRRPFAARFGLVPLAVPYEDSPPEVRILNMISAGLLFEGRGGDAEALGMTKLEFTRALRSLRVNGAIYVGPSGRYRLGFNTSNFPNITSR